MEKINALIDKLQELKNDGATLNELSYYTQLLYAELMCAKNDAAKSQPAVKKKVSVIMPGYTRMPVSNNPAAPPRQETTQPVREEEELIEVKSLETPPEPFRYETKEMEVSPPQKHFLPDYREQPIKSPVLTPFHGKELNEIIADSTPSLNDRLKQKNLELAEKLNDAPVRDLHKAIGINDKFQFINELFRGDQSMYDRSIKTINECSNHSDATYWIERELKVKLGWEDNRTVQQFYELIRKRFS